MTFSRGAVAGVITCLICAAAVSANDAPTLNKQALLDAETFWDNRDWDWYKANIPFFECPDRDIQTTYYYRWELLTKHLTFGSPRAGYTFTEFIDRPFWSGTYGAISCPAGHQLYEARWLRDPRFARDFARYWFETPGAQPRRYSTWLADAIWALHQVQPNNAFTTNLLTALVDNYRAWEKTHFDAGVGLFWQTGHDDGMEYNINSRQTADLVRGAPAFRPTLNAYMWADASAIANVADLAQKPAVAAEFRAKADALKQNLQTKLWDPTRRFFFPKAQRDEERGGHRITAGSLTYQSGQFAGDSHGRELIGYVPWQFGMLDQGYEQAWKFLMDPDRFMAPFGPTTVERRDPMFLVSKTCCWWSGQSWPYATTQTLKAMANLLQTTEQAIVTKADYLALLQTFARTHRKNGKPYIAEAANPDTGSFEGHDSYNHSEHYFHSGFNDLIITGLVGLRPNGGRDRVELVPLAPKSWDYFALDGVAFRGRELTMLWDRTGERYGRGPGFHILSNGHMLVTSTSLEPLRADLPNTPAQGVERRPRANYAVNNDGAYYPRVSASFSNAETPLAKLCDGNYWYHESPPNRWTCAGSPNETDWVEINFGTTRTLDAIKLYFLDDGARILPPENVSLGTRHDEKWIPIAIDNQPETPTGRRANVYSFAPIHTSRIRASFKHRPESRTGLTEFEAWGPADSQSLEPAPPPTDNLAYNAGNKAFPNATASFTSRFDKVERVHDGVAVFAPNPANRWTSYESPNERDWLELDFGATKRVARIELGIYDDGGGVQAPESYDAEFWDGAKWSPVRRVERSPAKPSGGQFNSLRFDAVDASKVRVVLHHREGSRSGLTEILVWPE